MGEKRKNELPAANNATDPQEEFKPSTYIVVFRFVELISLSVFGVVASSCLGPWCYAVISLSTFVAFLPWWFGTLLVGWNPLASIGSLLVASIFWWLCPLMFIWPVGEKCSGNYFKWFVGTRSTALWLGWCWIFYARKESLDVLCPVPSHILTEAVHVQDVLAIAKFG